MLSLALRPTSKRRSHEKIETGFSILGTWFYSSGAWFHFVESQTRVALRPQVLAAQLRTGGGAETLKPGNYHRPRLRNPVIYVRLAFLIGRYFALGQTKKCYLRDFLTVALAPTKKCYLRDF